jgi:hypothetical protein
MLTDKEIITKFKIRKTDRVLDIGGAMKQHAEIKIDTLVDIIRPEDAPYTSSKLSAKNFVKLDVTREKLPFADKSFDYCLCTHTLEDLYNPFLLIDEMSRVSKRGYVSTPSMGADMVFSDFDITNWLSGGVRVPGNSHHKWFFVKTPKGMKIIPKNYGILYSSKFHFTEWSGEEEMQYYWSGKINYFQVKDLNIHTLIDEYTKYVKNHRDKFTKGKVLFYLDKPQNLLKSYTKLLLKKGKGYKYRKD